MDLNQITIYTEKPAETAGFFQMLGMRLIVDSLPRYARLECPDGNSTLSVSLADGETETRPAENVLLSTITLYFECDDLDAEYERLMSLGIEFDQPPTDREWLWREAYLRDPNGNKICLFHAAENRKDPPWRVRSR